MEFRNDHISLNPPSSISYSMIGLKLPNNQDVYFRAKQREIVEQYSAARAMLMETECVDWQHDFVYIFVDLCCLQLLMKQNR